MKRKQILLTKMMMSVLFSLLVACPFSMAADDYLRGDVDLDGQVSVADVTGLIDYLLDGVWDYDPSQLNVQSFKANGVTFKMVFVEGGDFMMGDRNGSGYGDELPVHQVTLSDYSIGQTLVTQELWEAVMGDNPSCFKGLSTRPVECVTWDDCQEFITRLNAITGENFRLPTEAEWEYAARGGKYSMGYLYPGSNNVEDVAWHSGNSYSVTYPVGMKLPNELGIYDMGGNLWEWCNDWYGYYSNNENQVNPVGPESGPFRVIRGGYFVGSIQQCRVSHRGDSRYYRAQDYGLRLAL